MTAAAVQPGPWRRRLRRTAAALGVIVALGLGFMIVDGWRAFGHRATGARRARMERSPQWQRKDGHFENPQPLWNDGWGAMTAMFHASPYASPKEAVADGDHRSARFATPPATGLRVTWLGHSTMLIEIDGHRVLTDPVWSERASPFDWIGPRRWYTPPDRAVRAAADRRGASSRTTTTITWTTGPSPRMKDLERPRFVVPLGLGAHLAYWGVPESRIVEVDWWDRTRVGDLEIVCVPARHASGRMVLVQDGTLWAGYALVGTRHRAYFSGDTGLFPAMRDIGARLGPFDVTMIEVGQYHRAWPDWHIGPEQAVLAHGMVRGRVMLPDALGPVPRSRRTAGPSRSSARWRPAASAGAVIVTPRPGRQRRTRGAARARVAAGGRRSRGSRRRKTRSDRRR